MNKYFLFHLFIALVAISTIESRSIDGIEDSEISSSSLIERNTKSEPVAAASDPDNYEHHWDDGNKGDTGYIKNAEDKAKKGYKHFDSYHKKDKDNYDFEHHTAFGHGKKNDNDAHQHHSKQKTAEKGEKHSDDDDGDDEHAGKATHNSYQVSEDSSGEAPSGAINESADFSQDLDGLLAAVGYGQEAASGEANQGYTSGENANIQSNDGSVEYEGVVEDDGESQPVENEEYDED